MNEIEKHNNLLKRLNKLALDYKMYSDSAKNLCEVGRCSMEWRLKNDPNYTELDLQQDIGYMAKCESKVATYYGFYLELQFLLEKYI